MGRHKTLLVAAMMAAVVLAGSGLAEAAPIGVAVGVGDQTDPRMDGTKVVYTNHPSGWRSSPDADDREIWVYDTAAATSRLIASGVHSERADVSGDKVVYVKHIGADNVLVVYTLSTSRESKITSVPTGLVPCSNDPAIDGRDVVWSQVTATGDRQVCAADLTAVTTCTVASPFATDPDVSGGTAVWADARLSENDIYSCDLRTSTVTKLSTGHAHRSAPAVASGWVLWQVADDLWDPQSVVGFDRTAAGENVLDSTMAHSPRIGGTRAVWAFRRDPADLSDYSSDLYMRDVSSATGRRLTDSAQDKVPGDVSGDRIVWMQDAGGPSGWDVMLYTSLPTATTLTARASDVAPVKGTTVTISGMLTGAHAGSMVTLERAADGVGPWTPVASVPALASGSVAVTVTADATIYFRYRFAGETDLGPSTSPTVLVNPPSVRFERLAGADRYTTAVEVSKRAFPNGSDSAVIAYGLNYPDALAAAPLASAYYGPVLLTRLAVLPPEVDAELRRLRPTSIFVVGGTGAVSAAVFARLETIVGKGNVKRLGGGDRFATAALIADQLRLKVPNPEKVVVVNGLDFPDALIAAPLAARRGWPILLTRPTALPKTTSDEIAKLKPGGKVVIGTTADVSEAIRSRLGAQRVAGVDHYATCIALMDYATGLGMVPPSHVGVAVGTGYPDALSVGSYLALDAGMLVLTPTSAPPSVLITRLRLWRSLVRDVSIAGGTGVVSAGCTSSIATALK